MNQYLDAAIKAARAAGALVRGNFGRPLKVNVEEAHDIKLELDVRSQALIADSWLGAVCFCWRRADVVGHLIEEVGITLEVGCLFEAIRKALGALVEQKLSDVVTL